MLSSMVGQDVFIKGVSIYLKKHRFANAKTADLWAGISESSGQDVAKIMANWTEKVRSFCSRSCAVQRAEVDGRRLGSLFSPSRRRRMESPFDKIDS